MNVAEVLRRGPTAPKAEIPLACQAAAFSPNSAPSSSCLNQRQKAPTRRKADRRAMQSLPE